MSADGWMDLLMRQDRLSRLDQQRENLMLAAMLTGDECQLFGRRVRIRLEWIDAPPMTEDQLRQMGADMKARAVAESERLATETPTV